MAKYTVVLQRRYRDVEGEYQPYFAYVLAEDAIQAVLKGTAEAAEADRIDGVNGVEEHHYAALAVLRGHPTLTWLGAGLVPMEIV